VDIRTLAGGVVIDQYETLVLTLSKFRGER
jgi:hypothetical protein